jgi:hypothetical protein
MLRAVVGIIVGYALWTVIWLGGNAIIFMDIAESIGRDEAYLKPGPYLGVLALSIACSLAGGASVAAIAPRRARSATIILAALLLLTGIGVQIGVWDMMPLWYHLSFLGLLVPTVLAGGRLVAKHARDSRP